MNSLEYSGSSDTLNTKCCTNGKCGQKHFTESSGSELEAISPILRMDNNTNFGGTPLPSCEYTIEKSLGKGVFGEVFQATAANGHLVALKRLPKNGIKFDWNLVNREVDVGKRLQNHEGIAKLNSFFETVSNVYLVFEYVDGADLFSLMEERNFQPLSETEAKKYLRYIVDSLIYVHSQRVAHRDIKLDNILLDSKGIPKLIDFGLASMDEEEDKGCKSFVGSPEYVAPEIIQRKPYSGYKADVYSLGMVLYCMLFGQFPFIPEKRFEMIINGEEHPPLEWADQLVRFPGCCFVGRIAKDLLSKMLEVDPDKRISMEQIAKHKWMQGNTTNGVQHVHIFPNVHNEIDVC